MIFQDVRKLFASLGATLIKEGKKEKCEHQQNSPLIS